MTYASSQARTILDRTIAKGVTIKTIAEKSDVSIRTVSRLRNGHAVSELSALAVMNGLGVIWVERRESKDTKTQTLDATVEQLAAQRVNADLTHHADWDVDLQCAKYRRVMQLEAEAVKARVQADELKTELECSRIDVRRMQDVLAQREQHLKSCENALIEANEKLDNSQQQHSRAVMLLSDDRKEVQRLTALSETHGQSWKAASVQVEQLQKQLDHGQAQFKSLHDAYNQQIDDEAEMLAQIDTLFAERDNMRTEYEYSLMRLRVYVWILIAALVFIVASGFMVLRGGA